ncbi:hypothetical protein HH214_00315 [Mucilaginibacter robiniae]|uniref:Uncharacterized protein n=1 Tax=Mucilaginibacter robiniae TaxID=2728022 RepID=A0A7L5DTQ0_9SPHI|nr:hypothetical protein [Mucilaginibacter robiniae]QJD94422.1 hypothetical protein HH214_00315 [Mucilaginibacter robiniae]
MERLHELQMKHDNLKDEIHELTYAYYKTPMNANEKETIMASVFNLRSQCSKIEQQIVKQQVFTMLLTNNAYAGVN